MSVVPTHLVTGLAVGDVNNVQRQSEAVRRLSESNMVSFPISWRGC